MHCQESLTPAFNNATTSKTTTTKNEHGTGVGEVCVFQIGKLLLCIELRLFISVGDRLDSEVLGQ